LFNKLGSSVNRSLAKATLGALMAAALSFAVLGTPAMAAEGPSARQVKSAVQSTSDVGIRDFYKRRDYRPLWLDGNGRLRSEAGQLAVLIASSHVDGLNPEDFGLSQIRNAINGAQMGDARAAARAEMLLSRALVGYVRDLHRPSRAGMIYVDRELAPSQPDARAVLEKAASAHSLSSHLADIPNLNPVYAELRESFANYMARWGDLPDVRISAGPVLRTGSSGERVARLRERLGLSAGTLFDAGVARAVRDFKTAHGLPQDSLVDARTVSLLNQGPDQHRRLILANLERARALPPGDLGGRYIFVDAAAAQLTLYENGKVRDTMKVIVGKDAEQTPMMAAFIRYVAVNPYWNVPPDLVQRNIAPQVVSGGIPYLKDRGYQVLSDWSDNAKIVDPATIDWPAVAAGRKELRVRQLPGTNNFMGDMKFMLPNDYGIYLHDTPDKHLFRNANRMQSAGCVRVEDARRLAKWLLGEVPKVDYTDPERHVYLPKPVPVYITYLTAAPSPEGIAFRSDPYGRDAAMLAAISGGRETAAR
jgi:L,D-transpeptidase YcbB